MSKNKLSKATSSVIITILVSMIVVVLPIILGYFILYRNMYARSLLFSGCHTDCCVAMRCGEWVSSLAP